MKKLKSIFFIRVEGFNTQELATRGSFRALLKGIKPRIQIPYENNIPRPFRARLLICFIFLSFNIFAVPYDMILVGDPILEDIRYLSLESGQALLSFTAPLAPHEIAQFLDRIDESTLSPPAREAYNRVADRLNPRTPLSLTGEHFAFFFNINSTLEARAKFNNDVDWYPVYPKIPALLSLPIRLFFADTLQLYVDTAISADPYDYFNNDSLSGNIVFLGNDINGNSPMRAFVAAGGTWWNFQLGRDRLAFGTGISGNLAIADNPPFYEFMRLSFFSKYVKYSMLINHTPMKLEDTEFYPHGLDEDSLKTSIQRYFYLHRIDFNLFNVLSIALMEGIMVGNSSLELRYLNPLIIFHNAMLWRDYDIWAESKKRGGDGHMVGSFFSVEINWNITKALSAYGQIVMNELAINNEISKGSSEAPNGLGFMGGVQYSHSFDTWASVFYLECIYTYPYLYMNQTPFSSIIFMHNVEYFHSGKYFYYFGYPRDTLAITAGAKFFNSDKLILNCDFSWVSRGEHGGYPIEWDWEKSDTAFYATSPSGIPENNFILSVGGQWKVLSYLTLKGNLTGIFSQNNSDVFGGQASLSATFHY
ncbi:MAG: capsule assembly Wzi family protein [Treponema sp.]|jgi:hypothetical protein|nr:capsule assembly Wzi family protein [Treponema sp.]